METSATTSKEGGVLTRMSICGVSDNQKIVAPLATGFNQTQINIVYDNYKPNTAEVYQKLV